MKVVPGSERRTTVVCSPEARARAAIRKAVFALRQCLDAAIADNRLAINPATSVPLPSEPLKPPRFSPSPKWSSWSTPCPTDTNGGLFEDGSEAAVDRLDVLLGGVSKDSNNVLQLDTRKLR